jgi:hypothetical protein
MASQYTVKTSVLKYSSSPFHSKAMGVSRLFNREWHESTTDILAISIRKSV